MSAAAQKDIYSSLSQSLLEGVVNASEPSAERTVDILSTLQTESAKKKNSITIAILETSNIGKVLTKTVKTC